MAHDIDSRIRSLTAQVRGADREMRARETAEQLRAAAHAAGYAVSADDRIGESSLALLLNWAPRTLANRRGTGRAPPHYPVALHDGKVTHRITYRIADVAHWLEKMRDEAA